MTGIAPRRHCNHDLMGPAKLHARVCLASTWSWATALTRPAEASRYRGMTCEEPFVRTGKRNRSPSSVEYIF